MRSTIEGQVHKLGDNINTDYILSSRRKRDTLDLNVLKKYLMEDINPEFAGRVKAGDILVAGVNFGCGSAMEVASLVVKAAGIRVIVAQSFARTYYRNAINGGLLPMEAETGSIADQDRLRIEVGSKRIAIHNLTKDRTVTADLPGGLILDLFETGGLVDYIRRNGDFPSK